LLLAALTLGGCKTPNYFKPVTNVPPDKALIYVYRKYNYFGSGARHKIYANQKPITVLYTDNYYPYLADPGKVILSVKEELMGEESLFNFMQPKKTAAEINVEAGKTYFLKFNIPSALTFRMRYSLVDANVAENEITNCALGECLETNIVK
jgi:hypothetical protein